MKPNKPIPQKPSFGLGERPASAPLPNKPTPGRPSRPGMQPLPIKPGRPRPGMQPLPIKPGRPRPGSAPLGQMQKPAYDKGAAKKAALAAFGNR